MIDQFYTTLKRAQDEQFLVLIYSDRTRMDTSTGGRVCSLSADLVIIASLAPDGRPDGLTAVKMGNLLKIEFANKYLERLEQYATRYPIRNDVASEFLSAGDVVDFNDLLNRLAGKRWMVSVLLENEGLEDEHSGFIKECDGTDAEMEVINEYGKRDGQFIFHIAEVERVNIETDFEQNVKFLFGE